MNTNIEVLRELDELVEAARLLGVTQAKRGFGCYTDEDRRFERAMYESIDKRRAALLDWEAKQPAPQQPAAAGEEVLVNAAHDVYTLPLQPSGLSSGPRFVVHVPGPEQQPAAVDGAMVRKVAKAINAEMEGTDDVGGAWKRLGSNERRLRDRMARAALAAQHGGSDNDR